MEWLGGWGGWEDRVVGRMGWFSRIEWLLGWSGWEDGMVGRMG